MDNQFEKLVTLVNEWCILCATAQGIILLNTQISVQEVERPALPCFSMGRWLRYFVDKKSLHSGRFDSKFEFLIDFIDSILVIEVN